MEVNREEQWARVQPGVVQDELNHHVRPLGLLFGPDTSPSNRATIGGMLGNNSGGSHSIAYGLTVDHVLEMTVRLSDGSRVVFGEITPTAFEAKCRLRTLEGAIYREVARIRDEYRDEIHARYPPLSGGAWPATTSTSCSASRCGRARSRAVGTARRGRSAWRG